MRFLVTIACLLVAFLCCNARRRRQSLKPLAGTRRPDSGEVQESSSLVNRSASLLNDLASTEQSTQVTLDSPVKSSERILTKRQKRKRKSRRNRKSKKSRKGRKKNRKQRGSDFTKATKAVFDVSDESWKELLRSTMRRMFGFDHMTGPRPNHGGSHINEARSTTTPQPEVGENDGGKATTPLHQMDDDTHRSLPNPPDFMLKLYRTYSEDKSLMRINAQSQGNTIRSFFSVAGETMGRLKDKEKPLIIIPYDKIERSTQSVDTEEATFKRNSRKLKVFAFNVTSIPTAESIVAAELRLDGLRDAALLAARNPRSQNSSRSGWSAHIAVYKVANSNGDTNETRKIYQRVGRLITIRPSGSFAWVDRRIARLSSRARQDNHVLIVKFNRGKETTLTRRRRSSTPAFENHSHKSSLTSEASTITLPNYFVVVGSNRRKRNSAANYNRPPFVSSSGPASLTPILVVYCNDTKTAVSAPDTPVSNGIWGTVGNLSSLSTLKRTRRSPNRRLLDDSFPPSSGGSNNELPGETSRDGGSARGVPRFHTKVDNDQTELHDNGQVERRVIQQLKDRKALAKAKKGLKRRRGRKCRRRNRKGKKPRKCKKEKSLSAPEPDLNRAQQVCSRKSLHVDFSDIGWADWIISPKNFDAYYCSGLCELKTMKRTSPSNHAIVQAFIKSFDINPEVPAPCCVPEKLMSLSVLYFDQNDNVVLKVYPDMSVETCSCR